MSVEKAIICDGCAGLMEAGKNATAVRAGIRRDWPGALVALPGGRDLCPECAVTGSNAQEPDRA